MADNIYNPMLKQALIYYEYGWSIIPVPLSSKVTKKRWKQYQIQRPTKKQICKWFDREDMNIAVIVGKASNGLACRDFDTMLEYKGWAKEYPYPAKILPTVKTGKGMHVYFIGNIEGIRHVRNGELRGSGGYCLLPPSVHPNGACYEWINPFINGNLLEIDPVIAGFIADVTEITEKTEQIEAISVNERDFEKIIEDTLPEEYGTRNRKVFELARTLKSLPQFSESEPIELINIVKIWHEKALPNIRTKEFEETKIDFLKAWPRVKYKVQEQPMSKIFERAVQQTPPVMATKLYPDNQKIQLFVSLCKELQKEENQDNFYVSCRTAARYFNVKPMTISRWFFLLEQDGIIKVIVKGGTKKNPRKATRYKYIGSD